MAGIGYLVRECMRCLEDFTMGTDTRRPLAWEILNKIKTKINTAAADKTERLSKEMQDRKYGSSERLWWISR